MKSGISRSVADDKSVSVCPRFFPGPGEDPGEERHRRIDQRMGALEVSWGENIAYCTDLRPPAEIRLMSHSWFCDRVSRGQSSRRWRSFTFVCDYVWCIQNFKKVFPSNVVCT
ncbi:hypothetical protein ILYODFUR_008063 [Ilyodon furcidens]|uniref:Uncharacterized protein n=1 Tax=Ilyodon furcidens TaxID=33524 RepID=A0ABV0SXB4_9TELE